jgi:ribosomal protein L21E
MSVSKGFRKKTRKLFSKDFQDKGYNINQALIRYPIGKIVSVKINSGVHSGMPHYRFQGRSGEIISVNKRTYKISFPRLGKILLTNSLHIKSLNYES